MGTVSLISQLQIANSFYSLGLFDSALVYVTKSENLLVDKNIKNDYLTAELPYLRALIQIKTGDKESAESNLIVSLKISERIKDDSLIVLINKSLGNIYFSQYKTDKALDFYKQALNYELNRKNGSKKLIASLYQNIGIVYSTNGDYNLAKDYFNKSLALKEKILTKDDPQLPSGYLNYGWFLKIIGEPYSALEYFEKAEQIYLANYGKDYFGLAPLYFNKGSTYIVINDFDKALLYQERALELYRNRSNPDYAKIGEIYMNFGVIYSNLDQYDKAIEYYQKSLTLETSPESEIRALSKIARCYFDLNNENKALEYYKLSITKSESVLGENHLQTAVSYLDYGLFCDETTNYKEANILYSKALIIFESNLGDKCREVSNTLTDLGYNYYLMGNYVKSLHYLQKALNSYSNSFKIEDINTTPKIEDVDPDFNLFVIFYRKAFSFYEYYLKDTQSVKDLKTSFETSKLAIQLFEKLKSTYGGENTKLVITTKVNDIYNLAAMVASELYEKTKDYTFLQESFKFSEKTKAAILLSTIRETRAIQIGNIPETLRQEEISAKKELTSYRNLVYEENQKREPDTNKLLSLRKSLFDRGLHYDSLISYIENNYPQYYNLKYNYDAIKISDIKKRLEPNEAFIEYKIADTVLLTFIITEDTITLEEKILPADFAEKVNAYVNYCNHFPDGSNSHADFNSFAEISNYLYTYLIGKKSLPPQISNLIIVPDDYLGYITFETLIKDLPKGDLVNYKKLDYLIKNYSISYTYSGTLLFQNTIKKATDRGLLAMAPTYTNVTQINNKSFSSSRDLSKYLIPLVYTQDEVKNIHSIFKGDVLLGNNATEKEFKEMASKYSILHFAMHTIINDDDPLASKLVFTLNNDTTEDGFLNTYEIYNLDLHAELAVLSACKTGVGKLSKGEGIMSLARGFIYAGVPGIVMTLWEIEDISSSEIMTEFYRNLKAGLKKDDALRQAKLTYLESADQLQSHPYFWAAYVQIGDTLPVHVKSKVSILIYLIIVLVIAGGFVGIRRFIRKK